MADSDAPQGGAGRSGLQQGRAVGFEVGNAPRALAVTAGAVWVASGVDGRIRRIDLDRGTGHTPIAVGANPSAIAAGAGALWVASEEAGTVTRIDPRTGRVVEAIPVGSGAERGGRRRGRGVGRQPPVGTLARIDPERNAVTWSGAVGGDPTAVAVGEGAVWVAGGEDGTVVQVDPDGPRVVESRKTGSSPAAIAVAGGSVWAAADAPRPAHRGGTLRVLVPSSPKPRQSRSTGSDPHAPDRLGDVQSRRRWPTTAWSPTGAWRVPAGATLVGGAWPRRAPPPSRDGRSYVFTLRRGLRYSDGRPVQPGGLQGLDGALPAGHARPADQQLPQLYEGIVGAPRCIAANDRCDLSRGIETDARTRTITVHLTRPDAEFLHKLDDPVRVRGARGHALRAPRRAARRPAPGPTASPPGTSRRGGTFEPQPAFPVGDAARSRGAGFADRIEVVLRRLQEDRTADRRDAARYRRRRGPRGSVRQRPQPGSPASARGAGAGTAAAARRRGVPNGST